MLSKIYHLIGEGMEFTGGIGFYIYYVRIKIKQKYSVKLNWNKILKKPTKNSCELVVNAAERVVSEAFVLNFSRTYRPVARASGAWS